jgi:hypothetical protein
MPDLDAAYRLHISPDKLARGIVEASLLAGLSIEQVAKTTGLSSGAVEAYAALFFNVEGKLHANLYVLHEALGPRFLHGLTEEDVDVFMKWAAYVQGPLALPVLVRYFRFGCVIPESLDGLSHAELEELHARLTVRALF